MVDSLKKCPKGVSRAVRVPPALLDTLDIVHSLTAIQRRHRRRIRAQPLWSWSRTTAWQRVVAVMTQANITAGPHYALKGLRHDDTMHAWQKGGPCLGTRSG